MKMIRASAFAALLLVAAAAVRAQTPANLHEACFTGADGTVWTMSSDDSGTTLTRTATDGTSSSETGSWLPKAPAYGQPWTQGVNAANKLVRSHFFPTTNRITYALWTHEDYSRADVFNFTDSEGMIIAFQSTLCAGWNNCRGAANSPGVHCFTQFEDCCGAGTMFPQCITKGSGEQCCTWYLAAAQCNSTQSCCGMMGPGASSYAYCCNEGSSCCTARIGYDGTSSCCPAGTTCCQGGSVGLCCASDEVCEPDNNRCTKANATTASP